MTKINIRSVSRDSDGIWVDCMIDAKEYGFFVTYTDLDRIQALPKAAWRKALAVLLLPRYTAKAKRDELDNAALMGEEDVA